MTHECRLTATGRRAGQEEETPIWSRRRANSQHLSTPRGHFSSEGRLKLIPLFAQPVRALQEHRKCLLVPSKERQREADTVNFQREDSIWGFFNHQDTGQHYHPEHQHRSPSSVRSFYQTTFQTNADNPAYIPSYLRLPHCTEFCHFTLCLLRSSTCGVSLFALFRR